MSHYEKMVRALLRKSLQDRYNAEQHRRQDEAEVTRLLADMKGVK